MSDQNETAAIASICSKGAFWRMESTRISIMRAFCWSDDLTHEAVAEIRELGERLNKKKYADQITRSMKAGKSLLEMLPKESPASSSSSPSPTSAGSLSAT